ncbi:PD-(D/E)XK nuclease family protein [Candidatus Woesearchaeota archaeon]|nr:PD-(D/E)XK nuclease family protein [Candidatus Woesearchaeota archaeon]
MPKRVQSPSSINTFKQCPRKYFYQYIIKYPTKTNIHQVRGNIVHEALERFFDQKLEKIARQNFKQDISLFMKNLFDACWRGESKRLQTVGMTSDQLDFYYTESMQMIANWLNHFFEQMDKEMKKGASLADAFQKLKPIALEEHYIDDELSVRGYIDAITQEGEHVTLMDYKTSKSSELKDEYLLQLGIYAVLYEKKHGRFPKNVGLWFLKDCPKVISVTPKLIKDALFEIEQIHFATESDRIGDYPKRQSPLCRWSTGQCDFFDICMKEH